MNTDDGAWFVRFPVWCDGSTFDETLPLLETTMTQQEHQVQRQLVTLSLLLCPAGGRHPGKGHDAKLDADGR